MVILVVGLKIVNANLFVDVGICVLVGVVDGDGLEQEVFVGVQIGEFKLMLKVQEYLKSGKTLEDLNSELGIKITKHPELPLVILNYDQIESPKTNPIVRECRGIVLDIESNNLVARAFPRFFNWGEVQDEMKLFEWISVETTEKVDGSLVLIYNFDKEWRINTRGSFGQWPIFNSEYESNYHKLPITFTWQQAILKALGLNCTKELNYLDPSLTYVCEFVSPWNKVVRDYKTPALYLLTCYAGEEEVGCDLKDGFLPIERYKLNSEYLITEFLNNHPEATFEGVVIKDELNQRWKIKNARYLSLHRLKGNNGDALYAPKNLIPYILKGEGGELFVYFPEVVDCFNEYKNKVDNAYFQLEEVWKNSVKEGTQKDFALSIIGKTPFSSVLFNLRKENKNANVEDLKKLWRNSGDCILKALF